MDKIDILEYRGGMTGSISLGIPSVRSQEPDVAGRPNTPLLTDRFGRIGRDLRVSLTDKCNLRCQYCMPEEGIDPLPNDRLLNDDEIVRLISIALDKLGIEEIRFTGGEPLLRKGLESIVGQVSHMTNHLGVKPEMSLTTNALGLAKRAGKLKEAGLDRVNISIDSIDREVYAKLTRRDRLKDAVEGAKVAQEVGLTPVKVNAVLMPGVNDDQASPLLAFCLDNGYELRFIEYMPLGPRGSWKRGDMITAEDILDMLEKDFTLTPLGDTVRGTSPAELWGVAEGEHPAGRVGIIASVTRPFCGTCDRTRLTADGKIRNCLFGQSEIDLMGMMRDGASDDEIADRWRGAMWIKKAGHGIDDEGFLQPDRPMSAIGG